MRRQNNRWLRSNTKTVPVIMSTKFPTAVMVMGVISNEGDFWGKEVWPQSSTDCNPLDYYVWSACERTITRYPNNTLDPLKTAMVAVFAGMPFAEMTRACSRYLSRIQHVISAEGGFIECTFFFSFLQTIFDLIKKELG